MSDVNVGSVSVDAAGNATVSGMAGVYYSELAATQATIPTEAPEDFDGDQAEWESTRTEMVVRMAQSMGAQATAYAKAKTGQRGSVLTSDATPTEALRADVPENSSVAFRAVFVGRSTAGGFRSVIVHGAVQRVGAAAPTNLSYTAAHSAGSGGSAINILGNQLQLTVTGVVAQSWEWVVAYQALAVF